MSKQEPMDVLINKVRNNDLFMVEYSFIPRHEYSSYRKLGYSSLNMKARQRAVPKNLMLHGICPTGSHDIPKAKSGLHLALISCSQSDKFTF